MNNGLIVGLGAVCVVGAGLVHVLIWMLESVRWQEPEVWKRFGVKSQADAEAMAPMAYNQGFYNLFLAVGTIGGVVLMYVLDSSGPGTAVALFAAGSMVAAATVLVLSNRAMVQAAAVQGTLPLVGCLLLGIGW